MTVSNTVIKQSYNGNDVIVDFTIPFDFTSNSVIKVYLDDVLQTIITHYSLIGGPPVTTVRMVTAPPSGTILLIKRVTPLTQETDYSGTSFPAETVEESTDNLVRIQQELADNNTSSILLALNSVLSSIRLPIELANSFFKWNKTATALENSYAIPAWEASNAYVIGVVVLYSNVIYKCVSSHTSSVSFSSDVARWIGISGSQGIQGVQGQQGTKGDTGPIGPSGAAGANGGNGEDGVFSAIASQAEAQAGTDNTKGMTPLRTKEAIASQAPSNTDITNLQAADIVLAASIATLGDRVSVTETLITSSNYVGSQRLLNNQAVALPLLGSGAGVGGKNSALRVNASGTKHAEFTVEVYRKDDTSERLVSIELLLLYSGTTWYLGRKNTTKLVGEFDGVVFSLSQVGTEATVLYTSDNMTGGNYLVDSRIKWVGKEISIGV